jgi:hypothetical protein
MPEPFRPQPRNAPFRQNLTPPDRLIEFEGRRIQVPHDFSDEEIAQALTMQAPTQSSSSQAPRQGEPINGPTLDINGRRVQVSQDFLGMSRADQDRTVDEIAGSLSQTQLEQLGGERIANTVR